MLQIDRDTAQEALNGMLALAGTLPPSQATILSTFVNQIGRALQPAPAPESTGEGAAKTDEHGPVLP